MKQYYIFLNNEQIGPLSIEEVTSKKISKETKVWFEGLEDWKSAGEIEELSKILISSPPPINSFASKPPTPKFEQKIEIPKVEEEIEEEQKILGLNKKVFFGITGSIVLLLLFFTFNSYQENNRENLNQLNNETEKNNQQIDIQQKEIEEQKSRLAEQEQIEANRKVQERKNALESRYTELNNEMNELYENLNVAQQNLNNATSFKLLRSSGERNQEINSAQNDIDIIKEQIRRDDEEMRKINKQLGN